MWEVAHLAPLPSKTRQLSRFAPSGASDTGVRWSGRRAGARPGAPPTFLRGYTPRVRDEIPDARDGLTRKERVVLWVLGRTQAERDGRAVPLTQLYGRVVEHVDMSMAELQTIAERLGARKK